MSGGSGGREVGKLATSERSGQDGGKVRDLASHLPAHQSCLPPDPPALPDLPHPPDLPDLPALEIYFPSSL